MKRYNLLIILCSLFICTTTFAQQDTQFEFEFELVLDDDDSDDENEDDNDYESDDDDDSDDENEDDNDYGKGSNGNGEENGDDDLSSSLRAEVTLTNTGVPSLTDAITFRVHVGTTVPETLPTKYDAEHIVVFDIPLSSGNAKDFSISIPEEALQAGIDNIVTIWPVIEGGDNAEKEASNPPHYVYQMIFVPEESNNEKEDINLLTAEVNLYPNPTNGILQIEILNNHTANQIIIYNTSGQYIKTFKRTFELTTLDLRGLSSGVHFVAIRNENGQIIHYSKFVFYR